MTIELDSDQRYAVKKLSEALGKHRSVYLEAVVRSGKTYIAAELIKQRNQYPVLLVVPNRTNSNFGDVFTKMGIPWGNVGGSKGGKVKPDGVNIVTYKLMSDEKWLDYFALGINWSMVVFDEAHHVPDTMACKFVNYIQSLIAWNEPNVHCQFMYMSGTPVKGDGTDSRELASFVHKITVKDAIASGRHGKWLCELKEVDSFDDWQRQFWPRDKRTAIVFAGDSRTAKELYNKCKFPCALILGDTKESERSRAIADFNSGKLKVLIGVRVLAEGGDLRPTDILLVGKSQKSNVVIQQAMGRAAGQHMARLYYTPGVLGGPNEVIRKINGGITNGFGAAEARRIEGQQKRKKAKKKWWQW